MSTSMNASDNHESGADRSWLEQEKVFQRFERAWQQSGEPPFSEFLPPPGSEDRIPLLHELIRIDVEYRRRRGKQLSVADYLGRYPELNEAEALVRELLGETSSDSEERAGEERAGRRLGRYELREELGRGGFGTVVRGWDAQLQRDVAIKLPRAEFAGHADAKARAVREAQSAARLRHPGIVPIHEVGEHDGSLFIVYAFVPGPTLAQVFRDTRPAPSQVAEWTAFLADALDYAHRNGIVHRDVKPANILMDKDGRPVLADFGLARHLHADETLTQEGDLLGTLAYMSPEQAEGKGHEADPRSDVYSLGVVLYEGLCGVVPFGGAGVSVLQRIRHEEPRSPRQHKPALPADLETICLKALAKEPSRRYQSAAALAEDLRRYLKHLPIAARRIGVAGRLARWCRRQPALAGTMAVSLTAIALVAGVGLKQVLQERDRYRQERDRAEAHLYQALAGEARALMQARGSSWRDEALDKLAKAAAMSAVRDAADLRDLALHCVAGIHPSFRLARTCDPAHEGGVSAVALDPTGQWAASAGKDGVLRVWQASSGTLLATSGGLASPVTTLDFHPQRALLAAGDAAGTLHLWRFGPKLPEPSRRYDLQAGRIRQARFSTDGRWLVAACADKAVVWLDVETGKQKRWTGQSGAVTCLDVHPAGKILATGSLDQTIRFWDVTNGQEVASWNTSDPPHSVAFNSSSHEVVWTSQPLYGFGTFGLGVPIRLFGTKHRDAPVGGCWVQSVGILTGSMDGTLKIWDSEGQELAVADGAFGPIRALSCRRQQVVAGYQDGHVRFWEIQVPAERAWLGLHSVGAFLGDTHRLVGSNRLFDFAKQLPPTAEWPNTSIAALVLNADETELALGRSDGSIEIWNIARRALARRWQAHAKKLVALSGSRDGRRLASASDDGRLTVWDWTGGTAERELHADLGALGQVAWDESGKRLAALGEYGVALWDAGRDTPRWTRKHAWQWQGSLAFHGAAVVHGDADGKIVLRDADNGEIQRTLDGHRGAVSALAMSHDGAVLASAAADQTICVWNAGSGARTAIFRVEPHLPRCLAIDPQNRLLFAGGAAMPTLAIDLLRGHTITQMYPSADMCCQIARDGKSLFLGNAYGSVKLVRIADPPFATLAADAQERSGEPVRHDVTDFAVPGGQNTAVWGLAVSPKADWFALADHDGAAIIWDAKTLKPLHRLTGHADMIWGVAASPDGARLASGSFNRDHGEIKLWDAKTGQQQFHLRGHKRLVVGLAFHPREPVLYSAGLDGSVRVWDCAEGQALGLVHQFDLSVHQLAVRADARWLAAACHDGSTALWDMARLAAAVEPGQAPDRLLTGHKHAVWSVAFSPDGAYLASGDDAGNVILRDGDSFERLATFRLDCASVRSLSFSHDSRYLAVATFANFGRGVVLDLDAMRRRLRAMDLDW